MIIKNFGQLGDESDKCDEPDVIFVPQHAMQVRIDSQR